MAFRTAFPTFRVSTLACPAGTEKSALPTVSCRRREPIFTLFLVLTTALPAQGPETSPAGQPTRTRIRPARSTRSFFCGSLTLARLSSVTRQIS